MSTRPTRVVLQSDVHIVLPFRMVPEPTASAAEHGHPATAPMMTEAYGKSNPLHMGERRAQADLPWHELDGYQFEALKKFHSSIFADYQALPADFRGMQEFEEKFRDHLTKRLLALSKQGTPGQPSGMDRLRQEFVAASQGLLRWPRTIGVNQLIGRPELQQLLQRIQEAEHLQGRSY